MYFNRISVLSVAAVAAVSSIATAATYTDSFNTDTSANYNIFLSTNSSDATFAFDYSTLGIPVAPHTTDGSTVGLRMRSDYAAITTTPVPAVGAVSISPKNIGTGTAPYSVQVDVWGNYALATGTNSTEAEAIGVGANGTSEDSPNAPQGVFFDTFHDGGTGTTYRTYYNGLNQTGVTANYAAGSSSYTNAYYTAKFPSVSAPTVQQSNTDVGTGTTKAGTTGFAWHTYLVTNDGTNVVFSIDGTTITTVPVASVTSLSATDVMIGFFDSGVGVGTANNALINAGIFDNFLVTNVVTTPEPAALGLASLAAFGLLNRRKRA